MPEIDLQLNKTEVRVLGALIEKALTTPDYYPLSLKALKNACNQTSNRDPVVAYSEEIVQKTLEGLKSKQLVWSSQSGRVLKYGESFSKTENLMPCETIILVLLMLKGPQTPGALRARAERVHAFENLEALHKVLHNLSEWGFIQQLSRQAGHKELRYTHLFAAHAETEVDVHSSAQDEIKSYAKSDVSRLEQLESELIQMRSDFEQLKTEFLSFKNQF